MAIFGCQLDCSWNELYSRHGGLTCDPDLEAGIHVTLIQNMMLKGRSLIWVTPSAGNLYKNNEKSKGLFFACLLSPCHHSHSIGVYLLGILVYTEHQLRHPASWD